jgi:RimJ/RimL family protein N-acetyltransferase
MKSIGCKEEGILRQNCNSKAGRRNSIVLSILKPEWLQEVKQQLSKKLI